MADIKNCDKLISKLGKMNRILLDRLETTMVSSVQTVSTDARELCPVDTGQLKRSINYKVDKNSSSVTGVVGTQGVHYGKFIEFGTYKMKAQPFLTPAFKMRKVEVEANIRKTFNDVVREVGV